MSVFREEMNYLPEFNRQNNDRKDSYNLDYFLAEFNRYNENSCLLLEPMLTNTTDVKETIQLKEEITVANEQFNQSAVKQDIITNMPSAREKSADELKSKNSSTNEISDTMENANNYSEGKQIPPKKPQIKRRSHKPKKVDIELDKTPIICHEFQHLPLQHLFATKIPGPLATVGVSKNLTTQANNETPVGEIISDKVKSTKSTSTGATHENHESHMPLAYISSTKENVQKSTPNILNAKEKFSKNPSREICDSINDSCESMESNEPFNKQPMCNISTRADIDQSKKCFEELNNPIVKKRRLALLVEQKITAELTKRRISTETINKKNNIAYNMSSKREIVRDTKPIILNDKDICSDSSSCEVIEISNPIYVVDDSEPEVNVGEGSKANICLQSSTEEDQRESIEFSEDTQVPELIILRR